MTMVRSEPSFLKSIGGSPCISSGTCGVIESGNAIGAARHRIHAMGSALLPANANAGSARMSATNDFIVLRNAARAASCHLDGWRLSQLSYTDVPVAHRAGEHHAAMDLQSDVAAGGMHAGGLGVLHDLH